MKLNLMNYAMLGLASIFLSQASGIETNHPTKLHKLDKINVTLINQVDKNVGFKGSDFYAKTAPKMTADLIKNVKTNSKLHGAIVEPYHRILPKEMTSEPNQQLTFRIHFDPVVAQKRLHKETFIQEIKTGGCPYIVKCEVPTGLTKKIECRTKWLQTSGTEQVKFKFIVDKNYNVSCETNGLSEAPESEQ